VYLNLPGLAELVTSSARSAKSVVKPNPFNPFKIRKKILLQKNHREFVWLLTLNIQVVHRSDPYKCKIDLLWNDMFVICTVRSPELYCRSQLRNLHFASLPRLTIDFISGGVAQCKLLYCRIIYGLKEYTEHCPIMVEPGVSHYLKYILFLSEK